MKQSFQTATHKTLRAQLVQEELFHSKRKIPFKEGGAYFIRFLSQLSAEQSAKKVEELFSIKLANKVTEEATVFFIPSKTGLWAERLEELGGIDQLPSSFQDALKGVCAEEIIHFLSDYLDQEFHLISSEKPTNSDQPLASQSSYHLHFEIVTQADELQMEGVLEIPMTFVDLLLEKASRLPKEAHLSLGELPLRGELLFASAHISREDLRNLEPGAILMLDTPSALNDGKMTLKLHHGDKISISISQEELIHLKKPLESLLAQIPTATNSPEEGENTKHLDTPEASDDGNTPEAPDSIEEPGVLREKKEKKEKVEKIQDLQIDCQLDFSAGEAELSLNQLLKLQGEKNNADDSLFSLTSPVKIFLAEHLLGAGELFFLEEQAAIFVTQAESCCQI